ncbi:hypothetical protein METESE_16990 [Mesoterricola sediminis]|uniref:histidine kinase n=2 Tax=Mesoterricola sediminis TaxID=2927980 RepID=A0AA48H3E5_9BACT|nr:hypothetical protein METESE_16990 [Mesoterricola sediminis]
MASRSQADTQIDRGKTGASESADEPTSAARGHGEAKGHLKGTVQRFREQSERRAREKGLQKLSRMVQALSRASQAMARATSEADYLDEVCRIVVEDCGCNLAWVGFRSQGAARRIDPVAWAGVASAYMRTLVVTWGEDPRGQGPAGQAIRTGKPSLFNDLAADPTFGPWRKEAKFRDLGSSVGLPLMDGREAFGVLAVYASEPDAFGEAHVRVLDELAEGLARGILTLRLRESERRAQEALRVTSLHLQRLNDELEQRVQERTKDLVRANEELTARILDRDRAEEALRRSEEKLRHVQKMEAIGTLAGGVAHDFNNLLQVISGYSEMALEKVEADHPIRGLLETIQRAGQKGASLTRQLLAFSRKQVLAPEILDLNTLVGDMEMFFQRVLKEDIRLAFDLHPDLCLVEADPGQLQQVIMNLVSNAKDAMPKGGVLTLRTACAGASIQLSVSDTGEGMTPEVAARVFEPFFTTKGVGKGTGLGLSTALGIVEQSGGSLEVASRPGEGTTFTVVLPRAEGILAPRESPRNADRELGSETLLLVEDDAGVRHLTAHHLVASGYQVLEAPDGPSALEALRSHPEPVHLLLTDMVMPGMCGRELAERVTALRPEIRVLFMSGYPDIAQAAEAEGPAGAVLITKPFDRARLLGAVRDTLDAGPATPA